MWSAVAGRELLGLQAQAPGPLPAGGGWPEWEWGRGVLGLPTMPAAVGFRPVGPSATRRLSQGLCELQRLEGVGGRGDLACGQLPGVFCWLPGQRGPAGLGCRDPNAPQHLPADEGCPAVRSRTVKRGQHTERHTVSSPSLTGTPRPTEGGNELVTTEL